MTNELEKQFFDIYGIHPQVKEFEDKLVNIYPVITPDKIEDFRQEAMEEAQLKIEV